MKATVAEVISRLPRPPSTRWPHGEPFAVALRHGTMVVEIFAPRGLDRQSPHTRDELYFVISGRGEFVQSGARTTFGPGDAIFVAAGEEHRFENFSEDFATWAVFYGPEGGEKP